jgi:hypothetical protein
VAAVANYGDRVAESDPVDVPAARPGHSSTFTVLRARRQPWRARQIARAQCLVQLVRTLEFAYTQCVDGTPSTLVYPPSTLVYPPSTPHLPPRVHSCRSPSPAHRALNRRVLFARVARAVRTRRRAFYAR